MAYGTDVNKCADWFLQNLPLLYWADKNDPTSQNDSDPSLVKNPSNFNPPPPPHRNILLDTHIDYLTKYPLDETCQNKKKIHPTSKGMNGQELWNSKKMKI